MANVITERTPSWVVQNTVCTGYTVADNTAVDNSVFIDDTAGTVKQAANNSVWSDDCDDGNNDGKLSFGSAVASTLKGAGKSLWNTVKGIVTDPKKLVIAAATTAVCIAFPPAGVALGAFGIASGVYSGGKAIMKAVELYNDPQNATDAEAKAAFEDLGAATLQVGLSAVAVKGSLGAMKATQGSALSTVTKSAQTGIKGLAENTVNYSKAFAKDTITGGRGADTAAQGYKATQILSSMKDGVSANGGIKATVSSRTSGTFESLKSGQALQNARAGAGKAFNGTKSIVLHPISSTTSAFGKFSNLAKSAGYSSAPMAFAPSAVFGITSHNANNSNIEKVQYEQYQNQMANYTYGYNTEFTQLTSNAPSANFDFGVDYNEIEAEAGKVVTDFMTSI